MSSYFFAFVLAVSSVSFAQSRLVNKTTTKQSTVRKTYSNTMENAFSKPNDSVTRGFRFGFTRPQYAASLNYAVRNGATVAGDSDSPSVNYTNGLKFGYANLPVGALGYIADFDYLEVNVEEKSNNIVRLDGNAAIAVTPLFNVHAGLNYADLVGTGASKWDAGYGTQFGIGYQMTRNFGFELNYSETKLSTSLPLDQIRPGAFASVDFKLRGYDLNFIGTF